MKFKIAATAGLSLTLDPMGKMFQNASSLKPLGQLKPNCPAMIIGRSSVFYADRKSKMAATTGHSINTEPYGENTEIYSLFQRQMILDSILCHKIGTKTRGSQEPVSFTW
jgi:hypothetical protein